MSHSKLVAQFGSKLEEPATEDQLSDIEAAAARQEARRAAEAHYLKAFERYELERVGRHDEYLADREGLLYEVFRPEMSGLITPGLSVSDADAWYEGDDGWPIFLKRPPKREPQTRGEIDQAREQFRNRRREAEREELEKLLKQPLEPYTLGRLENRSLPTLRDAAVRIERAHGVLQDEDGRLVVLFHGEPPGGVADSVRVLRAEQELVLAALEQKTEEQTLTDLLPDEQARA